MMKLAKFLTARSTVISLFIAISSALLVASSVPQRSSMVSKPPAWLEKLPGALQQPATLLGLDYIVGTGWFALLVTLFWISLLISTMSQFTATKAVANRMPAAAVPEESVLIPVSVAVFAAVAITAGYRPAGSSDGVHRFVKNRAGYWGNFLLHIGLVTAVLFSLVYVVTQHRVLIRLTGQEITRLEPGNVQELRGVFPLQQQLPYTAVLKTLEPRFWENDKLEYLSSELYFTGQPGGDPQRVDVAVSDKSQYGPYIVYQANAFGMAFDLELAAASGEVLRERLFLPYPSRRDMAGYGEMPVPGTDFLLKGKFFADKEQQTIKLKEPLLTLRLFRGKELQGEVTLSPGDRGQLGPLAVGLGQSAWWTDILLDGTRGTSGIFAGFALILAGVLASYCLVPREIIVREKAGVIYVQHVARRFAQFYREEFEEILKRLKVKG